MDLSEIASALSPCATEAAIIDKRTGWFIFGTALSGGPTSDIDIALIYENLSVPDFVREHTRTMPPPFPLHLTFLEAKEEKELKFLNLVGAQPLF